MGTDQAFPDHFSAVAGTYATSRPTYPDAIYEFVASIAPATSRAWDCATGNGQAARGLAMHFREVCASDASAEQIANALPVNNVSYSVQRAEGTDYPDAGFDAVTVAQALHWFELDAFARELARVLKPGGVFVTFAYSWFRIDPDIDAIVSDAFLKPVSGFWPSRNESAWKGYSDVQLPLDRIEAPKLDLFCDWKLDELAAYLSTWSALNRHIERHGPGLLEALVEKLEPAWGGAQRRRRVSMDLFVRAWRKPARPEDQP